jgi:hypothetical protein
VSEQFAVVQTHLDPPDPEKLQRAFRGVPGLTPYDVNTVCNEGGGILGRNFTPAQASVLKSNLKAEGVEVEIVEKSGLPVLPQGKTIHHVRFTPEALMVEDLIKGEIPVPWEQAYLIAAGSVQLAKIARQEKEVDEVRFGPVRGIIPVPHTWHRVEYSSKVSADWFLRAEIILAGAAVRYSIEAEHFTFAPLGEGVTKDLAGNFCLLMRGLAAQAPKALLSRGAASIASEACEFVYYPRKSAFEDDIIWLLWKAQQSSAEQ